MAAARPPVSARDGAWESKEMARARVFRALVIASFGGWTMFLLAVAVSLLAGPRAPRTRVVVVPYRELAPPPPLTQSIPQVPIAQPVAPPPAATPVPVLDAKAPPDSTIASQQDLLAILPDAGIESGSIVIPRDTTEDATPVPDLTYPYEDAKPTRLVKPKYPEVARRVGLEGLVVLVALVGQDGRVLAVRLEDPEHSPPILARAAEEALRQWSFEPALSSDRPVAVRVRVPFNFNLTSVDRPRRSKAGRP